METIESLRERLEALEHQTEALAQQFRYAERRLRWWRGITCSVVVLGLLSLALPSGEAQVELSAKKKKNRSLPERVEALEHKLVHVTAGANEVVITGANLRIVNGLGSTETTNGLGNLIVGYNELRNDSSSVHTGSHNVAVGRRNNFSSFGGLVVGESNEISGEFSSVTGGSDNIASGASSSVSGGAENTAVVRHSSVSGGFANRTTNTFASVSGGVVNTASGEFSSVSGGAANLANGFGSSVSGGAQNEPSGEFSSVSGGFSRVAPDQFNWAAGPLFAAQ